MRNHTETAQIIQLSASRPKFGKRIASRSRPVAANPQCEENVSTTCNARFRAAKAKARSAEVDPVMARRAEAYRDMEPHVCDLVKMGTIAFQLFDDPNRELYDFAVCRLSEMLYQFKAQYYAE